MTPSSGRRAWIAVVAGVVTGHALLAAPPWWRDGRLIAFALAMSVTGLLFGRRDWRQRRPACAGAGAGGPPAD